MRINLARLNPAIAAYMGSVAAANQVSAADVAHAFNVLPSVQDKLEKDMQENSSFLKAINIIGVTQQEGRSIGVGATRPIASRTDTSGALERQAREAHTLSADTYKCTQTNFDTALRYDTLDAWAHKPEFPVLVASSFRDAQALDRIMIGWNGTSVAPTSNKATNPLLQDVNVGWLQKLRAYNSGSQVLAAVNVGATGDFKNLDALVFDLIQGLDPWHRDRTDLVVITSRALLHDKYLPIIDNADKATEKVAAEILQGARNLGGLPAIAVPHFPAGKVLVTTLKNLSIYYQLDARRRTVIDNPKKDQLENYESSNDAYVIEDLGGAMLADGITAV